MFLGPKRLVETGLNRFLVSLQVCKMEMDWRLDCSCSLNQSWYFPVLGLDFQALLLSVAPRSLGDSPLSLELPNNSWPPQRLGVLQPTAASLARQWSSELGSLWSRMSWFEVLTAAKATFACAKLLIWAQEEYAWIKDDMSKYKNNRSRNYLVKGKIISSWNLEKCIKTLKIQGKLQKLEILIKQNKKMGNENIAANG